jgi:hypothetical protein
MGGRDVDGHGMYTAGSVESRETDAHGVDAFSVAGGLSRIRKVRGRIADQVNRLIGYF